LRRAKEWAPVIGTTALAAALRLFALREIPLGLYRDEAFNGLDALKVLAGQWPIYFAANHGREPLFIYLIAATVGLLGRTPGALRLAAAMCGTLTIPITYLMIRAWFNRRVGLLSAVILAITLWHVHLSRVGFRAVTLPLTTALALWLGARAYRSRRRRDWLLAGLVYGLCFYAYLPIRLTPIALAIFALYLLCTGRGGRLWPGAVWFAVSSMVTLTPLAIYAVGHWDVVISRPGQVSAFNPLVSGGDLWETLGRQLLDTLGMFFVQGDTIPRHNLPGRPAFDPLMGIAMVLGLGRVALNARWKASYVFALVWVGLMLVPTWLSEDAPHFLRAVGVLPLVTIFPALGLDAAMTWMGECRWAVVATCMVLAISLGLTAWDYFVRYAGDLQTGYAFESAAVELAAEANRFTGIGWDGNGLTAQGDSPRSGRRVYIDDRLWNEWEAVPFLVPESASVAILSVAASSSLPPVGGGQEGGEATLILLWPYEGLGCYQEFLPLNARIEAHGGPLTRGDLEETPYEAYVAFAATPVVEPTEHLVYLGDRIALIGCAVDVGEQTWQVRLEWEALSPIEQNYTVFVHLRDGEQVIAQHDGEPATGHYPTSLWRSGDVVVDTHVLELPEDWDDEAQIVVGLYTWPSLEKLKATTPNGESLGDEVVVSCQMNNEQ
jgi:4-amino-4-deoxy-L-arabinose transferase-like glycosyltransferase